MFKRTFLPILLAAVGAFVLWTSGVSAGNGTSSTNNGSPNTTTTDTGTGTGTGTASSLSVSTQTGTVVSGSSIVYEINGTNPTSSGYDHNYTSGQLNLNFLNQSQLPPPPNGYTYTSQQDPTTGAYFYVAVDSSGNVSNPPVRYQEFTATFTGTSTGTSTSISSGQTVYYVPLVPAAATGSVDVSSVNGTATSVSTSDSVGISVTGQHVPSQLTGGLTNGLTNDTGSIEAIVEAARKNANTFISLRSGANYNAPDPNSFGDPSTMTPKIVYATGVQNADGTITEGDLHFGGSFVGAGLLVIEITDPNNAKLVMDGSSMWVGEIIIVAHYIPTKNNAAPLTTVGGGTAIHIIGGATVYDMNELRPNDPANTTVLGQTLTNFSGNADLQFSSMAINLANKVSPSAVQVRSWRKVRENE